MNADAFSVHVTDGTTTPSPVTDRWAQLQTIAQPTMDAILSFRTEPEDLEAADRRIDALFDD